MPSYHFETQGLTNYVVFVEGMVQATTTTTLHQQKKVSKIETKFVSENENEVSFYLYYGAGDNDVAVAKLTLNY